MKSSIASESVHMNIFTSSYHFELLNRTAPTEDS
jgi:hypothetical protein